MRRVDPLYGAVALAVVGVVGLSSATWLAITVGPPHAHGWLYVSWQWAVVLSADVLGLRIVQTRPRHPIGWILIAIGFLGGVTDLAEMWAYAGLVWRPGHYPGAAVADAINTGSWASAFGGLAFLLLFFPDGRVPSPRWRWVPWALGVAVVGMWAGSSVKPGLQQNPFEHVRNPAGVAWTGHFPGIVLVAACAVTLAGCLLAAAYSVRRRFRLADGEERAQLFWLVYAAVLVPAALLGCLIGLYLTGTDVVGDIVLPFALLLVPGSIGLAVLRYRLYDIEYLVGRTIVYGVSTAVVFAVFALTALALGVIAGHSSPVAVAVATLGAVLVARPVHRRAQTWVNRRFDRDVAEGVAVMDAFDALVREGRVEVAGIEVALTKALREPIRLCLWLPREEHFVTCEGYPVAPGADGTEVRRGEALLGVLEHSRDLDRRHRLRDAVLGRALLNIEMARLAAENATAMSEVEASRNRILEATHEERRRLERDLHDGAQQRLVALGVRVRRLQRSLPADATVAPALDATVDEISETIQDLRRLAAGVRPARLDDGLVPALEDLARTTPVPIVLDVDAGRLPTGVETSAYFVACEAVTNAVKHASASRIEVRIDRDGESLRVRVCDDGIGGARVRPRSGLAGLVDRVAAVGGHLVLTSEPGRGTALEVELPCGS